MRYGKKYAAAGMAFMAAAMAAAGLHPAAGPARRRGTQAVAVVIRNVNFRFDPDLSLYVDYLRGELLPAEAGQPASFDHPHSFLISIASARVAMSADSLARLMNAYVFGLPGSGFTHIKVQFKRSKLREQGTIHKGIPMPAELSGTMRPTRSGMIRFHPTRIKALHLPLGGLMHLVGINIGDFIHQKKTRGLRLEHGDLILDPQTALPAPHVLGRVTGIRIGRRLWLQLSGAGSASSGTPAATRLATRGYMRYLGGVLRFGYMRMQPADLTIINAAPRGPFDFFLRHYQQQLAAGHAQATPTYGWVVFMPGFSALPLREQKRMPPAPKP